MILYAHYLQIKKSGEIMRFIFIAIFLLLSIDYPADSAVIPDDFKYSAEIAGPVQKNTHYQVILPDEILTKCFQDCRDFRLSGPDDSEIPYVVLKNISLEKIEKYDLEVINYDYNDDSGTTVITLKLPHNYKPISIMHLSTTEHDFKRGLQLYGSYEAGKWELIKEDTIYDFSSQVNLRKTEINFKPSDYRYYMIKMLKGQMTDVASENMSLQYNDLQLIVTNLKKDGKISISRFTGQTSSEESRTAVYDEIELKEFDRSIEKEKDTVITFEAPLQFEKVFFNIADPYYYRHVDIFVSDSGKKDSYKLLSKDFIYRFDISGDEEIKDYITCSSKQHKFYKIIINNKDNPPLALQTIKLKWLQKVLYFIGLHDSPSYSLYIGNPLLKQPEYDLSRFIRQDNRDVKVSEPLQISSIVENHAYQPAESPVDRERTEKTVLTFIVILMTAGISFWLYTLLKKTSGTGKAS